LGVRVARGDEYRAEDGGERPGAITRLSGSASPLLLKWPRPTIMQPVSSASRASGSRTVRISRSLFVSTVRSIADISGSSATMPTSRRLTSAASRSQSRGIDSSTRKLVPAVASMASTSTR
jgi:hypothetical protein